MAFYNTLFPLSTTFTPPATCTQDQFTMLENQAYEIWLNYPEPVPGTTVGNCYPAQFLSSYLSQQTATTVLNPIQPLICPVGYEQVTTISADGYLACCPSGFSLAPPTTSSIGTRPAYGGTCYTDIETVLVTAYGNDSVTATSTWTAAPAGGAQAYALLIEGFASVTTTSSSNPTGKSTPSPLIIPSSAIASSTASTIPAPASHHNSTAAIAGGVIAGILGSASILGLAFFWLRHRRLAARSPPVEKDNQSDHHHLHGSSHENKHGFVAVSEMMGTPEEEMAAEKDGTSYSTVAEMDTRPKSVVKEPSELDCGEHVR